MKWANLSSLSTITQTESHPFVVFGKPVTKSIERCPFSTQEYLMVASDPTISDVQSSTSGKSNKHKQTQLLPSSFLASKKISSGLDTS